MYLYNSIKFHENDEVSQIVTVWRISINYPHISSEMILFNLLLLPGVVRRKQNKPYVEKIEAF